MYQIVIISREGLIIESTVPGYIFDQEIEPDGRRLDTITGGEMTVRALSTINEILDTGNKLFFDYESQGQKVLILGLTFAFEVDLELVMCIRTMNMENKFQRDLLIEASTGICNAYRRKRYCELSQVFRDGRIGG